MERSEILDLMMALGPAAASAGGQVVALAGNHEAEFLADPANSKSVDFVNELQSLGQSPSDVASGMTPEGAFMRSLPFAAKVGNWFMSHAGNTHGMTVAQLESAIEAGLDQQGLAAPILSDPDSILEARLSPPWWEGGPDSPESTLAATRSFSVTAFSMSG